MVMCHNVLACNLCYYKILKCVALIAQPFSSQDLESPQVSAGQALSRHVHAMFGNASSSNQCVARLVSKTAFGRFVQNTHGH